MTKIPIACNLEAIDASERDHHLALGERWWAAVQEIRDLPDGYGFRIAPEPGLLMLLAEFVSRERLCCPFFEFEIAVEAGGGPVWLRLRGDEAVKAFVRESLPEVSE